jgi:hypothetical protein
MSMSNRKFSLGRVHARMFAALWLAAAVTLPATLAHAQFGNCGFRNQGVGGISIDADGVVGQPVAEERDLAMAFMKEHVKRAPDELNRSVELRMVSMRGLQAAIEHALAHSNGVLPEDVKFLAGLQRIQYVFVYPEQNDIVLAGPGEGWRVDENANVVGITTGRPVILLDDLLVAFRTVKASRRDPISCSIDPTPEGRDALQAYLRNIKTFSVAAVKGMEKAMGPQTITITGVPADSHFARVLVASDYRMKRIAMNLDKSPVAGLPGFLDLMKQKRVKLDNMMPRWWLACNYEPLARSEDGLSWELRGPGVKAMTENDFIGDAGNVRGGGGKNPVAQEWADLMTANYDELAARDTVFGELRNLMDLCVVAALIEKEDLMGRAGCRVPLLTSGDSELENESWIAPKAVSTQCSFLKAGSEYIITASGGVLVESWAVASRAEKSGQIEKVRAKVTPATNGQWRWN